MSPILVAVAVWLLVSNPGPVGPSGLMGSSGFFNVADYGADGSDAKSDTEAIQAAIDAAIAAGGATVFFPPGTYRCQLTLAIQTTPANAPFPSFQGSGTNATRLMATEVGKAAISIKSKAAWEWPWSIRDLSFVGNGRTANGIDVNGVSGVLGCTFQNVAFFDCDYGFRNTGALWYTFDHCSFSRNNFGTYIEALPTMHGGCGFFENCNWYVNFKAAFVLLEANRDIPVSQVRIAGGVNEGNPGFAFFSKGGSWTYPLTLDGVYVEANATAPSVTIAGKSYKPSDIYLENAGRAVLQNMAMPRIKIISNTMITANNCTWYQTSDVNVIPDANNAVVFNELFLAGDRSVVPHFVNSGMSIPWGGTRSTTWQTHVSDLVAWDRPNLLSNGLCAVPFTPGAANSLSCTFVEAPTPLGFGQCAKLALKPGATSWRDGIRLWSTNVNVTNGKWYVWTLDLKAEKDDGLVSFIGTGREQLILAKDLPIYRDRWTRYAGCKQATATGGISTWSFFNQTKSEVSVMVCDAQLVEFGEYQDAYQYVLDRRVAADSTLPRPHIGETAVASDYVINSSTDNGKNFTNAGAARITTVVLASATAGQRYTFTRVAAREFHVSPISSERFRDHPPGKYLNLDTDGQSATVQCLENGIWDITATYNPNGIRSLFAWEP